jgi:hypothetical protein
MKKRYTVLGLSVFLAIALAVPALGGPSNPVAHTASALSKAKKAIGLANSAQGTANTALSTANAAKTAAATAQTAANAAKTAADAANANANTRLIGTTRRIGTATTNTAGSKSTSVSCTGSNEVPTGGGYVMGGTAPAGAVVTDSEPTFYNDGWFVAGDNQSGIATAWSLSAVVECGHP